MRMKTKTFFDLCSKFEKYTNAQPEYIPSKDEIDELLRLTRITRTEERLMQVEDEDPDKAKVGRTYTLENKQKFISQRGKPGMPLVSEENAYSYLIYISETASSDDPTVKENKRYLNQFMASNLQLVDKMPSEKKAKAEETQ